MQSACNEVAVAVSSPIGLLQIVGCQRGMHSVQRVHKQLVAQPDLATKCTVHQADCENLPKPVQQCLDWFREYFAIDATALDQKRPVVNGQHTQICPNLALTEFSLKVYTKLASDVKFGSRISYSGLAELIGHPKAARAVGTALKKNPFAIIIPCHRVVKSGGEIGFYAGGKDCAPLKEWILNYEKSALKN